MADQYGVCRDTIRRAIQELVSENRLVVLHGRVLGAYAARRLLDEIGSVVEAWIPPSKQDRKGAGCPYLGSQCR